MHLLDSYWRVRWVTQRSNRHEICQKNHRPQFCTLKMRKLRLFLLSIKQCKFQYRLLSSFFVEIKMNVKIVVNVVAKTVAKIVVNIIVNIGCQDCCQDCTCSHCITKLIYCVNFWYFFTPSLKENAICSFLSGPNVYVWILEVWKRAVRFLPRKII